MTSCINREKYGVSLRNTIGMLKQRSSLILNRNSFMSAKTKNFIQKICYKKTASFDMTQYGFINDSKVHPVNLLLRPLRAQLERICGRPSTSTSIRRHTSTKRVKLEVPDTASSARSRAVSPSIQSTSRTPTSAASSPGTRTPRRRTRQTHQSRAPVRKIAATKPNRPAYKKKRVTVTPAPNKVKKNEVIVTRR
ncbi:unnamed protein product [Chrysodeixis includens]|uniref:Uncharacterized protein n=1 Tax=Chrysodeixis includens TaxID=689277 RepID=A0A9P0C1R0_CHRIL|nr:unnamed protein product [Chrysodeixis includens]